MNDKKKERYIQLGLLSGLVALGLLVYVLVPGFYDDMWELILSGDVQRMAEVLQSYGPWAMVISFALDVLINALGFLPSIFFSTANGLLFGVVPGIIISWLAETVGVVLSFMIMRYILRDTAHKVIEKSEFLLKVDDFSGKNGLVMMLFARSIPYFPSGIITALGAISQISLRDYIIANLIGKFPSTALEVIVGHDTVLLQDNLGRLAVVVLIATVIYFLLWKGYQRWAKQR
ncbi:MULTISPECIES: TVP38/TMEM64 family protein [unclassified Veillonella]|uniref:TVP38/TMEM64 family protein n=1 Tax=unclassified Veillonella TaxID=2630086 RepID=UPI00021A30EC|nr:MULTISPECIES: TVP38/TMEM64 family protein [unclassified Veillonella]EGS38947.1 SNARE-like domain protein [Veillonella sp. oral taxon 780 str. F0422]KXB88071.1 SNARE-like domain protein [Veillonella sp. DNF00869]